MTLLTVVHSSDETKIESSFLSVSFLGLVSTTLYSCGTRMYIKGRRSYLPEVQHTPVMAVEVLEGLKISSNGTYIDCTVGDGGHAKEVLGASTPAPRLLGIDLDEEALRVASSRLGGSNRVVLCRSNFTGLAEVASSRGFSPADGVLFDLGVSSRILENPLRGFSFSNSGPLDMRFDQEQPLTANDIVNHVNESELANVIYEFGEDRMSRRIARAIVSRRPLQTTGQLATVVRSALGSRPTRGIHPATRTFQAIRIAVNREIDNIRSGLESAIRILSPGGRLVVISYHSIEDRLVKRKFLAESSINETAKIKLVNRKVIKPSRQEVLLNPRSRSAKMRVVERI